MSKCEAKSGEKMKRDYTGSFGSLKEFWEEKGRTKSFERGYSIRLEGVTQIVNEIRTFLDGKLVLDVGCGPGIAASLFPANAKVVGLDFSVSMLKGAKDRILHLVQGSAFNLPFYDNLFDAVTCLFVTSDYSDKSGIFDEAHRVLRDKGYLLFSDYSLNDEHWRLRKEIHPIMGERCDIFLNDETSLSNEIMRAGFKVQEIKYFKFYSSFNLERYVRSDDEMRRLKTLNPDMWNKVQRYIINKKINREFILIIGTK